MSRADVAWLYRQAGRHVLVVAASGNASARHTDGLRITASGAAAARTRPRHIVTLDLSGTCRDRLLPSSEWPMHAAVYQGAPTAAFILHTHSDAAVALACLAEPLPAFHYAVAAFGGADIRCAPYALFGSPSLARLAAEAIAGRTACLLANHGMICHGPTAEAALDAALRLEALCRQYLLARAAGIPRLLTTAEITAALARYQTYGQQKDQAS